MVGGQLEKQPGIAAALMQLPGGMEIAGAKPGGGSNAIPFRYPAADVVKAFPNSRRVRQIGQDGQIIAGLGLGQQSVEG